MRRVTIRIATAISATLAVLLSSGAAWALPFSGGELRVQRSAEASDCPDEQAFAASTAALGTPSAEISSSALSVVVELARDQGGYVARIRATGRKSGERELRSTEDSCEALAEAVGLVLAVLFDLLPDDGDGSAFPSSADTPPVATAPPAFSVTPAPRASAPPDTRRSQPHAGASRPPPATRPVVWLGAYPGVASGLLGHALSGQLGAAIHARLGRRLAWGTGGFWAPGRDVSHGPGVVSVFLAAGREEITLTLARSARGELAARAEFLLGAIAGRGRGYDRDRTATELWLAAGLGAAGRWRLGPRWWLALSTLLIVPHRTQTFSVAEVPGSAYRGAPAAVLIELGPELDLF